ncbi:hypothetical protein IAQ61_009563 [Plenodomus lingam]|uniref:Predicted protein n=1 Tax=Leptosphaeria maculans (strain JN3 / isolate v23.1.3 / race Av1-4-5-6-7-8) TaxID=985895 RepID=E4ZT12_LEPMJ|nr:predicted protein [Plenodomus lingam JN3]KAH9863286.1 hypothetical protein IAQ61_009563 [Plenodomus lingam]CBX94600.1 predicted protein [Plenodomus lingam JN3]
MAIGYERIQCRACYRVLAIASANGLVPENSGPQDCDTCWPFSAYYNAVQNVDREWAEMEPKRDSLKARQIARLNHIQIHMEFDNWLLKIEAVQDGEPHTKGSADDIKKGGELIRNLDQQQQQHVTKRRFSDSSTPQYTTDDTLSDELPDKQAHEQQGGSLSLFPSPEKSCRTSLLSHRKRLKFSDSVEFRDDYRDSAEYLRTDESYVRGRYAPPDGSEYLDTSGSAQTFLKFSGVRRVKGNWVEVRDTDTATKRKDKQAALEGAPDDAGTLRGPACDAPRKINDNEGAPRDQRALRLARRTKDTSGTSVIQVKRLARPAKDSLDQKAMQTSLSSTFQLNK